MIPYFIVFTIISIFSFIIDSSKSKYVKYFFSVFLFISFISLYYYRDYNIGTDTLNYIPIFQSIFDSNNILDYSLNYDIEVGFSLVVHLFGLFTKDYFHIFLFLTSIIYINLIVSIYRYRLSYTIFFCSLFCVFPIYFYSFNILRQAIAMSFIILAASYLVSNNNKKFFLYCFFAFSFHYPSIIALAFYIVYKFRYKIVEFWYLSIFTMVFSLGVLYRYVVGSFDKYSYYDIADSITSSGGVLINIFYISLLFLGISLKRYVYTMRSELLFFLAVYCFYISLSIFFLTTAFLNQGMVRISFYFLWPSILIILVLIKNISNEYMRYVTFCSYYLFLIFFTAYYLSNAGTEIVPYRFR